MFVIIMGDTFSGQRVIGPFNKASEAKDWISVNILEDKYSFSWNITRLEDQKDV